MHARTNAKPYLKKNFLVLSTVFHIHTYTYISLYTNTWYMVIRQCNSTINDDNIKSDNDGMVKWQNYMKELL